MLWAALTMILIIAMASTKHLDILASNLFALVSIVLKYSTRYTDGSRKQLSDMIWSVCAIF